MSVAAPDYLEAGYLLSAYGARLGQEGDDEGAQKALSTAMAIAKHEGDLTLEMATLINAAWVDVSHLRFEASLEKSLRAIELAEQMDDPLPGRNAYLHALRIEYNTADLPSARRHGATHLALTERTGNPDLLAVSLYGNQKVAALEGDWQSARSFFERGLHEVPQISALVYIQTMAEHNVGDFKQGEVLLDRLIHFFHAAPPEPGFTHLYVVRAIADVARMTGTINHFDIATKAAETILASQRVSPLLVWSARAGLALMAVQQGDSKTVQEQYNVMKGERGTFGYMDVDRVLGILTAAIGELDQAVTYFEAALAIWRKGRYPESAWTAYDFADTLLQRGNPGDPSRAAALLNEALTISSELGMGPLKERILLKRRESGTM